jgi:hypothetical protein
MTETDTTAPPALHRVLDLLADPPAEPDTTNGYLDLLAADSADATAVPRNTGWIQAVWASPLGSMLYDNSQALSRRLFTAMRHPAEWLAIPPGGVALDVGCGPGNVTASLADAAGPDGLAMGVDISEPMLTRAVHRLHPRGRTTAPVSRRDGRRCELDRGVAACPRSGGGTRRDAPGAAARRATGRDGAHRRPGRTVLAVAAQFRRAHIRRRRTRRHLGGARLHEHSDNHPRHHPVGARQARLIPHGTAGCAVSAPSVRSPRRSCADRGESQSSTQ